MVFARDVSIRKLLYTSVSIAILLFIWMTLHASAQAGTASISQGFPTTDKTLSNGTLLSLQQKDQQTVEAANPANVNLLVGVVSTQPLLALSGTGEQVQVVISGITPALVSDINGTIKAGDKITASPISGVGMKATSNTQVVGTAQTDFSTTKAQTQTINDTTGKVHTVYVELIPVQVNVDYYNVVSIKSSVLPGFLQSFADSVAGHDVSALRLFMSGVVLVLGLASVGVLMSSAVRSSLISIGRNPLSEGVVQKSLIKISLAGIGILLLVLSAIYLILRI